MLHPYYIRTIYAPPASVVSKRVKSDWRSRLANDTKWWNTGRRSRSVTEGVGCYLEAKEI